MGEYSNLLLNRRLLRLRKPPACNKLRITTVFGSQEPLKDHLTKSTDEDHQLMVILMMIENNYLCLRIIKVVQIVVHQVIQHQLVVFVTKAQRDYINQRGNNRRNTEYPSYLDI